MPGGLDWKSGMSWMAAVCIGEKVTGWCGGRRREKTCRPRHKKEGRICLEYHGVTE